MAMDGIDRDNLISAQSYPYLFKPSMSKKATIHDNLIRVSPQKNIWYVWWYHRFFFNLFCLNWVEKFCFHQSVLRGIQDQENMLIFRVCLKGRVVLRRRSRYKDLPLSRSHTSISSQQPWLPDLFFPGRKDWRTSYSSKQNSCEMDDGPIRGFQPHLFSPATILYPITDHTVVLPEN